MNSGRRVNSNDSIKQIDEEYEVEISRKNKLTPELIPDLHHGPVARNVRLTAQRVVRLPSAQHSGDAIHGKRCALLILELLDQFLVLYGPLMQPTLISFS